MERANFLKEKFGSIKVYIILCPYMDYCPSEGDSYLAAEGGDGYLGGDGYFLLQKKSVEKLHMSRKFCTFALVR